MTKLNKPDFAAMTIPEMLRSYNEMVATAAVLGSPDYRPLISFKDRTRGLAKCEMMHSTIQALYDGLRGVGKEDTSPGLARLRAAPNAEEIRQNTLADQQKATKTVSDERNPADEGTGVPVPTEEEVKMAEAKKNGKPKKERKPNEKKEGTGRRGRAPTYMDDMVITKIVEGNPKREGTKAHEWFAGYRSGMKVSTYVEKVGRPTAMGCLRWDVEHEYITVA